ncbi:conserved hypothetical protein [Methanospirillum hungatei JF-1]|uniref:Uncharacterized protein n=1 Tax=Methanospirillum hungatei JF-1 (strain ATCC 27890 / DSM 864 / NBRC 100397 / JF-1) TaxID=323259 RepID=Q2FSL8_METHJ|nr:hypothetical protein [Methanospirillum hungatei]ABD42392.1 conserved hypothetical protein [Methanospirillum hungatei JF-1]
MTHNITSKANPVIHKATDMLMAMSRDEEERLIYEAREEFLLDQQYGLQAAERKGIIETKQETARKLITKGMDDQFIKDITGLEFKEISSLRDEKRFNSLPKNNNEFLPLYGVNIMTHNITSKANPVIQKATDMLIAMSWDEEERLRYEAREEFLLDQKHSLQAAERTGIEIGEKKGIEIERIAIAHNLINLGMDDEFISKATGLPPKEIRKLRNQE